MKKTLKVLSIAIVALVMFSLLPAGRVAQADGGEDQTIQEQVFPYLDIILDGATHVTNLSSDVLQNELAAGETLAQIGSERGLNADFPPKFLQATSGAIDAHLASGDLSVDDAASARQLFKDKLNDIINTPYIADSGASLASSAATTPPADQVTGPAIPPRRLNVVATTVQITALTKAVGGDAIDLTGIIPAGADPHEFEPVASDLKAIEKANLILRHGMGLDDWLDGTLEAGGSAQSATVTKGINGLQGNEDGKRVADPHVWHDPENAKIMTNNIASALTALDPGDAGIFSANAVAEDRRLDDAKTQGLALVAQLPVDSRKLVTSHDAFGYFARAFGFKIVGAVIPSISTESEPSAKDIAQLEDTIKSQHVKAIFAETSVNPHLASTVAKDAGAKIVTGLYGDSLGQDGSGAETVEGMILTNIRLIVDALK